MTRTGAAARPDLDDRTENLVEWAQLHSRLLTIIAVVIVALVGGGWFYMKAHQVRARNASTALSQAELALASGNLALAQSNIERIVARYGGTRAGKQAQLLLAEVYYDKGQYQQGVSALQKLVDSGVDDEFLLASAYDLIGAGQEQQEKYADAAAAYQKAAETAPFSADRDRYLANAARALTSAGKTADAKAIWLKLAADPTSVSAAEARVRLGELEATKAGEKAGA